MEFSLIFFTACTVFQVYLKIMRSKSATRSLAIIKREDTFFVRKCSCEKVQKNQNLFWNFTYLAVPLLRIYLTNYYNYEKVFGNGSPYGCDFVS